MKNQIDLFVGGAFSGMAQTMDHNSVSAFIDAQCEIDRVKQMMNLVGVTNSNQKTFPLVPGETFHGLLSQFEGLDHPFIEYALTQPNTQLETGLGMEKLCGYLVAKLIESHGLKQFLEDLYGLFFKSNNGMHNEAGIRVWAGQAGGTGPDVGRALAETIGQIVGGKSGHTTTVNLIRIGAFSYEGLGDRTWDNAAAALFEDLIWILSSRKRKEEVRRLILVELPTVSTDGNLIGTSKEIRDYLAVQLAQALSSPEVNVILDRRNPNLDLSPSGYGTIRLLQADWWYAIPTPQIILSAAHFYKARLESFDFHVTTLVMDTINLPEIRVEVYPKDECITPVKEIAERLLNSSSMPSKSEFENQIRGIRPFEAQVLFEYQHQRWKESIKKDLENPKSVAEYISSLRHLFGIVETLEDKIRAYQTEKAEVQHGLNEAEKRLVSALDLWYPESLGAKLKSAVSSVAGKLNALKQSIDIYRAKAEKLARVEKAIETLEGVLLRHRREFEDYRNRPLKLKENLAKILAELGEPDKLVHLNWFQFRNLDDVFADLLLNRHNLESLQKLLNWKCPQFIKNDGLGKIVDIHEDISPESILSSLLDGKPKFRGPCWGGSNPISNPEETIIVFPPLSVGTLSGLNNALKKNQKWQEVSSLVEAESFVGGANILILRVYKASHPWEVIPQPYFYKIQTMERDHFFIDWAGMMKEERCKKIYEKLCQHYQLNEEPSFEVIKL